MKIKKLITALALPQLAGLIGAFFTMESVKTWYVDINKPFFTPPNWIFAPVWTLLYLMMGISHYLIWTSKTKEVTKKAAFNYYYMQLALNTLWSILFFGLQNPWLGFGGIIILLITIIQTLRYFKIINIKAFYVLLPYTAWVSFATILNLAVALMN